ncbi:MAG: isoleucine--tRNA ligase [Candidatus Erginobacter occultus]|nr:isoleucine--tRNA ligase [Candidatus Erginobacter occultus]
MTDQHDYKQTLNLPRTSFGMRADLARKEPEYLVRWEKMGLYEEIRRARAGKDNYTLHDGPPYPSGDLHIGTGMNKILKDFVIRFQTMSGFDAPYIPGWDCHGLPIEHKVMTGLGEEAEKLSAPEIRRRCREFALNYVGTNRKEFKRLGCSGDWENPYLTINPGYEAAVLKVFKTMVERGYVYRQLKPIHWCGSCRTALAEAELEYRDRQDISIYLHLPLVSSISELFPGEEDGPVSILIWTTTPWTLPANRAVAVNPAFSYALISYRDPAGGQERRMILAAEAVERVAGEAGIASWTVRGKITGKSLENLLYRHPWEDRECPVITADYVNLEEGTGCVHTAPGHGQEDYLSGRKYGLEIASPVDERGVFTDEAAGLSGLPVMSANGRIVEELDKRGWLLSQREIGHSYPHCWRCRKPVIFRATRQWFVSLENRDLRQRLLEEIERVEWLPEWGQTRIRGMLEGRPDWCISRQRTWGVPIPAFYCRSCGRELLEPGVIDHVTGLFAERGSDCWFELSPTELLPAETSCPGCGGSDFTKENDIFDVWFESGSSHRAVVIENSRLVFPADLYLEGTDQHRGWFQLSLLLALATTDRAPFRSVLTHGFVVDRNGEKMSKSRGNFISVAAALKEFPADILRLWFASIDYRKDIAVSLDLIKKIAEAYRKIRNTFKYCLGNLGDFDPASDSVPPAEMEEIDRWILAQAEELRERVSEAYRKFEFHRVYREIYNFCVIPMSSFYMDVLKDRLYTYAARGRERRSTQTALREVTGLLTRLLAPILVFTAEEVWGHLSSPDQGPESVHLADWPEPRPDWRDDRLTSRWEKLLSFRGEVLKLLEEIRGAGEIGTSLEAEITVEVADPEWEQLLSSYRELLPKICIVSGVTLRKAAGEDFSPEARSTEIPSIRLLAARARGSKCLRCWKYSPTVGDWPEHPGVCAECRGQMG